MIPPPPMHDPDQRSAEDLLEHLVQHQPEGGAEHEKPHDDKLHPRR